MDVHPTKHVSIGIDPYPDNLDNLDVASRCARVAKRCADCASAIPLSGRRWGKKGRDLLGKMLEKWRLQGWDLMRVSLKYFLGIDRKSVLEHIKNRCFPLFCLQWVVLHHFRFIASCTLTSLRAGASLRKAAAAKPYGARCSSGSLCPNHRQLDLDPIYGIFPGSICGCHRMALRWTILWHHLL